MNITTILDQIDMGSIALPEFQRGYVWNRDQVRGLMNSLYRRHPIGSLLVWETKTEQVIDHARGDGKLSMGSVKLLLDGQQRITSFYGIVRGRPPQFFDGNVQAFTGLYFNLEDEIFEFYAPVKMKDNPLWVNVTELMQQGVGIFIQRLLNIPELSLNLTTYINVLNKLEGIKNINLHIEEVAGEDKTVDVVVEIFNTVNSGGTKLSKGDLALAKVCAQWPDARSELKARLAKWNKAGFDFRLEWLLRCINAVITGEAVFSALKDVKTATFQDGLYKAEKAIDTLLNLISARLGLDHNRVLGGIYAFPLMVRYLVGRGGHLRDYTERDKLLYWYVHTLLWGRYAGSTESVLTQDLHVLESEDNPLDQLIANLRQNRGDLEIKAIDFQGWGMGARFYPLVYMLTRVHQAQDWDSGIELSKHLLGKHCYLQVHHIFPKSLLSKAGYPKSEVNAIANLTFLTQETNLKVSNRHPSEYFEAFETTQPGAIATHWIPMERRLWQIENYRDFLTARRDRLAQAANKFLNSLLAGDIPEPKATDSILEPEAESSTVVVPLAEERVLEECNVWVQEQGLPMGELMYEITDSLGTVSAVIDLAWTNGLQSGKSQPIALLIDANQEIEEAANRLGYRYFTDIDRFKSYVIQEVLAVDFPTVDDYKQAFIAISSQLTDSHKRMPKAHYHAPGQIITVTELAEAAGYEHFGGANLQYARIAELVANYLKYSPRQHDDSGKPFWSLMLASGYWKTLEDSEITSQREWQWQLREQVSQALEDLGWV
ncbi:GmrSD restriction endonuclease domain-containing protein [Nostoc sp.]|uniref:GmrSD restriction endonuclease domain-containing protein n=1 Tax=Nostoc sp. TaxID=1180 RepID=UPI002FF5E7BA